MTILVCQFGTETNTFAPGWTEFEQQAPYGWIRGETVEEKFGGGRAFLGGALSAIKDQGEVALPVDLITINGSFGAGPPLSKACVDTILDHICQQIQEKLGQFDGIYFALHGAGVAEHTDDLESLTLRRLRQIVGPNMPIMSSLDLHGNLTEEMLSLNLWTKGLPDPDLLIRTGAESRISNFLLWQSAYSELYFTETLFPDFSPDKLDEAIKWFSGRKRRYGGV